MERRGPGSVFYVDNCPILEFAIYLFNFYHSPFLGKFKKINIYIYIYGLSPTYLNPPPPPMPPLMWTMFFFTLVLLFFPIFRHIFYIKS